MIRYLKFVTIALSVLAIAVASIYIANRMFGRVSFGENIFMFLVSSISLFYSIWANPEIYTRSRGTVRTLLFALGLIIIAFCFGTVGELISNGSFGAAYSASMACFVFEAWYNKRKKEKEENL